MAQIDVEFLTTDATQRELCRQYWLLGESGKFAHSVPALAAAFGIPKSKITTAVAASCVAFSPDDSCTTCTSHRAYKNRSEYVERRRQFRVGAWECDACRAAKQEAARRAREVQDQVRRSVLQAELDHHVKQGIAIDRLSLRDAVLLASVLRTGGAEDFTFVFPLDQFQETLSPRGAFDDEVVNHLYGRRVLCVHPGSRPESVVLEDGKFTRFFPAKVHWVIPLGSNGPSPARFVQDLEARLRDRSSWPAAWSHEAAELHHEVALQECLAYLELAMEDHDFDVHIGEKTLLVLRAALRSFSIAQVYGLIWRAAKDAAAFYVRESVPKPHAANIVPGSIQRLAERALANGWSMTEYRRDRRLPVSKLSHILFTVALSLPDDGFTSIAPTHGEPVSAADNALPK